MNRLWADLEPVLKKLCNVSITDEEKSFGIVTKNLKTGQAMRNWLSFMLRESISKEEKKSYHTKTRPDIRKVKREFNSKVKTEIRIKIFQHEEAGQLTKYEELITYGNILCKKGLDNQYEIRDVFPVQ